MSQDEERKVHPLPFQSLYEEILWSNRTIIAASAAAVVGVVSGYPFDSIKTRLQTTHYDSINACIKQTYKEEGVRGFFRGVIPPLITVSIIKSISFSVYEKSKAHYKQLYPQVFNQNTMLSTMAISTFSGTISGAFIATLSCPFELVKVQKQLEFLLLQTSSVSAGATVMHSMRDLKPTMNKTVGAGLPVTPIAIPPVVKATTPATISNAAAANTTISNIPPLPPHSTQPPPAAHKHHPHHHQHQHKKRDTYTSTSSWYSAREIVKKKGLLGLYSGFSLHLIRDTVGTGVYFGGYETTKYVLSGGNKSHTGSPPTQFLAGGICGIMCWLVVFPLDLVKTLIQKEILLPQPTYKDARECIKDIYARNGMTGFYRGITVTLIRAFPIHSLNFLVYEQTLVLVHHLSNHHTTS